MEAMTEGKRAEWHHGPYIVTADWHGGAYIELTMPDCIGPTEVINVWDYEAGEATIPFTYSALQDALDTWCEQEFGEGNPDGDYNLRAYITNASY